VPAPPTTRPAARGDALGRLCLAALIAVFPLAYLPRLLFGDARLPEPPSPRWAHVVVVTASRWPARGELDDPRLAELGRRASYADQVYAPCASRAGSAASLWTGRWPSNHGVLADDLALPPDAWTLAEAARRSGARTAAFLAEPFASATGVGGFERVVEDAAYDPRGLARDARAFLARHAGERTLVWLHLRDAGAGGRDAGELIGALHDASAASGRWIDTLTVATGFARAEDGGAEDARLRVPLWVELPSRLYAGRRSTGAASLVDLAGLACDLLALPLPDPARGDAALQSRARHLGTTVKGGGGFEWLLLESADRRTLRFGKTRVEAHGRPPAGDDAFVTRELEDPTRDDGFREVTGELRLRMIHTWRQVAELVQEGATAPVPAPRRLDAE